MQFSTELKSTEECNTLKSSSSAPVLLCRALLQSNRQTDSPEQDSCSQKGFSVVLGLTCFTIFFSSFCKGKHVCVNECGSHKSDPISINEGLTNVFRPEPLTQYFDTIWSVLIWKDGSEKLQYVNVKKTVWEPGWHRVCACAHMW